LLGPWVDEVRLVVAALRTTDAVCLNLEHLSFADSDGIELLRAFRRNGIQLVHGSPLIEGLLVSHQESVTTSVVTKARE
jgi:hypothetical protein